MTALNRQREKLLGKPSLKSDECAVCGGRATNQHHVIPRGAGGTGSKELEALIPTVSLCGMGNVTGCHGAVHKGRIEFDYDEERQLWKWRRKGATAWHACHGQVHWKTYGGRR